MELVHYALQDQEDIMAECFSATDPRRIHDEVRSIYLSHFPTGKFEILSRITWDIADFYAGRRSGYQACDTRYHDWEHTLLGTLALVRLLDGMIRSQQFRIDQRLFSLGTIAILLHDTGYLKTIDDVMGTGGKYTLTHVQRGTEFAASYLSRLGFPQADIESVQKFILCTNLSLDTAEINFSNSEEKSVGYAVGTADLLGQMADPRYVTKLPLLFEEFLEAARYTGVSVTKLAGCQSAEDLEQKTPDFFYRLIPGLLNSHLGSVYKFYEYHFADGQNHYLEEITRNVKTIRRT